MCSKKRKDDLDLFDDSEERFEGMPNLEEILSTFKAPFRFGELVKKLAEELGDSVSDDKIRFLLQSIEGSIYAEDIILCGDRKHPADLLCAARKSYLADAQMAVQLIPEEMDGGFFIPGHRMIPFLQQEDIPDIKLFASGKKLAKRDIKIPIPVYARTSILYGPIRSLVAVSHKNPGIVEIAFTQSKEPLTVEVFDIKPLLAATDGKTSGRFVLKAKDLKNLEFELLPASQEEGLSATFEWISRMDKALEELCGKTERPPALDEQIAQAMLLDGWFKSHPAMTVAEYLRKTQGFELIEENEEYQNSFLWPKDAKLPELEELDENDLFKDLDLDNSDLFKEEEAPLDEFLKDRNFNLNRAVLLSYMLEELSFGKGLAVNAVARALKGRTEQLDEFSDEEWNFFHFHVASLWIDALATQKRGERPDFLAIRKTLLSAKDKILAFLRAFDSSGKSGKNFLKNDGPKLSEMDAMLDEALQTIAYNDIEDEKDERNLAALKALLPTMDMTLPVVMDSIDPAITKRAFHACAEPVVAKPTLFDELHEFEATSPKDKKKTALKISLAGKSTFEEFSKRLAQLFKFKSAEEHRFFLQPNGKFKKGYNGNVVSFEIVASELEPCNDEDTAWASSEEIQLAALRLRPGTELAFVNESGAETWLKLKFKGLAKKS